MNPCAPVEVCAAHGVLLRGEASFDVVELFSLPLKIVVFFVRVTWLGDGDEFAVRLPDFSDGQASVRDFAPRGDDLRSFDDGKARPRLFGEPGLGVGTVEPALCVRL